MSSRVSNPYDFANPVSEVRRLFGREKVKSDITYYLEYAAYSPRPINIALLGERAAGKTSIMNVTEIEAKHRGFCTVRVDLDEADAESALVFFHKILDAILHSALALEAFGGFSGRTYQTYIETLTGLPMTADASLFSTFLFPVHYGTCMRTNNFKVPVSDSAIAHDLKKIAAEIKRPTIIFFDESNVLAGSRILLEKLRNTFMNLPGYMLVLAGTPDMFPLIDDVFSPIIRQFKKIEIGPFSDVKETAACIREPLEDVEESVFVAERTVQEIHDLSGGRPYEIQLICHLLFRRMKAEKAQRLQLDFRALEDLRTELAQSQDGNTRVIISKMASLTKRDIECLSALTRASGHAHMDEIKRLNALFPLEKNFSDAELDRGCEIFLEKQLISSNDGIISFDGDYFDRIYAKYFAREQKVILNVDKFPVRNAVAVELLGIFLNCGADALRVPLDFVKHLRLLDGALASEELDLTSVMSAAPSLIEEFYFNQFAYQGREKYSLRAIRVEAVGVKVAFVIELDEVGDLEALNKAVEYLAIRAASISGVVHQEDLSAVVFPLTQLEASVLRGSDMQLRERLSRRHQEHAVEAYLDKNLELASRHLQMGISIAEVKDFTVNNNLGYLSMALGEWKRAKGPLEKAAILAGSLQEILLGSYNLAILAMHDGNETAAKAILEPLQSLLEELPSEDNEMSCLLFPKKERDGLRFEEISGPLLTEKISELLVGNFL